MKSRHYKEKKGGRRLSRIFFLGIFVLFLLLQNNIAALAGWTKTPEWRYLNEDGTWKQKEWYQDEKGEWYYFDDKGLMMTGFLTLDGDTYFFNCDGHRESGLVKVNDRIYYFDNDGRMLIGERIINGNRITLTPAGADQEEVSVTKEKTYILKEDGELVNESQLPESPERKASLNLPSFFMLAFGVFLFVLCKKRDDKKEVFLLYIAVLFASTPLFLPYLFKNHDIIFHLNRILGLKESLKQGMFPVRLNAFTFNGFGYGEPVFYPSLLLYIPALMNLFGIPFVDSVNIWLLLVNIATAAVMYYSATRLFGSCVTGCISSIFYTLGIYRLGNIYTRGSYGELMAMIFFPLIIYGFYELFFGDRKKWWILTVGLTGVMQSHIISTLFAAAGCVIAALVCIRRIFDKGRFASCLKMGISTLLLNIWFLVPLLDYMKAGINLDALQFKAEEFTLTLSKLLEIYPIAMGATPSSYAGASGTMALSLGLPILAGIVLCVWNRMDKMKDRKADILLLTGLVVSLLATNLFPWELLMKTAVFKVIGSYIQFPWRLLNVSLCFLSLACAYAVCRRWKARYYGYAALAVLLLCVISSQHLLEGYYQSKAYFWSEKDVPSMIDQNEYLYSDTKKTLAMGSELPAGEGVAITDSHKKGLETTLTYRAEKEGEMAYVDMPLFYYPGYQAVDQAGNRLPVIKSDDGLARVVLAVAKEGTITIIYKERRLWRICEIISAFTALAMIFYHIRERKKNGAEK